MSSFYPGFILIVKSSWIHPHYFICQGANIDPLDKDCRTPLLLAAAKKSWKCVNILLERGANKSVRDMRNRNILHLIIKNGGKPQLFSCCMSSKVSTKLKQTFITVALDHEEAIHIYHCLY